MQWYYTQDGQQRGPVEEAELFAMGRDGRLGADAHVWNETMGDQWTAASDIPGLLAPTPDPQARRLTLARRSEEGAPEATQAEAGSGPEDKGGRAEAPPENFEQPPKPESVSCVSPMRGAWNHMQRMLFGPFSFQRWLTIAVGAWLMTIPRGGCVAKPSSFYTSQPDGSAFPDSHEIVDVLKTHVFPVLHDYMGVIIGVSAVLIVIGLIFGLFFLWLRCRGTFIFLDNVITDRADVGTPWTEFAEHAHSLFLWKIGYGVCMLLLASALGAITAYLAVIPWYQAGGEITASAQVGFGVSVGLWVPYMCLAGLVSLFLYSFVVPIMYHYDLTAREAWGRFLGLLMPNLGRFILWALWMILLKLGSLVCGAVLVAAVVLGTACIAGCLMAVPIGGSYVLAFAVLPISVFFRAYTLEYLEQYGPPYTFLPPDSENVAADPS